jgi:hypothetical protein
MPNQEQVNRLVRWQLELRVEQLEVVRGVRQFGGIEQIVGRLMISHCPPRDCDFARQGIARLRLRSTFYSTSESKVVELPRRTHAVG